MGVKAVLIHTPVQKVAVMHLKVFGNRHKKIEGPTETSEAEPNRKHVSVTSSLKNKNKPVCCNISVFRRRLISA